MAGYKCMTCNTTFAVKPVLGDLRQGPDCYNCGCGQDAIIAN